MVINKQKGNVKYTIKCIPNEAGENNKQEMIVTLMPNEAGGNNKQDLIVTLVPKKGLEINKQEDKVELDFDNRLDELVASMDDFLYWNKIKIRIDDIHYKAMVNYKQEAKVESFYDWARIRIRIDDILDKAVAIHKQEDWGLLMCFPPCGGTIGIRIRDILIKAVKINKQEAKARSIDDFCPDWELTEIGIDGTLNKAVEINDQEEKVALSKEKAKEELLKQQAKEHQRKQRLKLDEERRRIEQEQKEILERTITMRLKRATTATEEGLEEIRELFDLAFFTAKDRVNDKTRNLIDIALKEAMEFEKERVLYEQKMDASAKADMVNKDRLDSLYSKLDRIGKSK